MLMAELLHRGSSRAPASYRHRLIAWAFCLLLCYPLLSLVLPQINVPLPWPSATVETVRVEQAVLLQGSPSVEQRVPWLTLFWMTGCIIALLPVVAGYWQSRRHSRHAEAITDTAWLISLASCCSELGIQGQPLLLVASSPVMPQTFGLRRACLLLPAECLQWPEAKRRAVLLHELAHVQRHDVQWQLLAHVVTALWWFQPLCWLSRRTLRREAEEACDAAVLACGVRASDYAAELLGIASSFRQSRWQTVAIAMRGRGSLERRLRTILLAPDQPVLPQRRALAMSVLFLFAISASALTIGPGNSNQTKGVLSMKRTIFSGLLTSAGLSAAMITGSLNDGKGGAVTDAKASLYSPDTALRQQAQIGPTGKFAFENLPAGAYILRVDKPGFAPVLEEFNVAQDAKIERGLTLPRNADNMQSRVLTVSSTPHAIKLDPNDAEAKLVHQVQPAYPASAKANRVQGKVILQLLISPTGVPTQIHVISSPDNDLAESALEAVGQWRYSSTLLNGQPIEVSTEVVVSYTLSQ